MMQKRSRAEAALLAWTDIAPEEESGFNDWYDREHMRDRVLGLPGFVRGRRFLNSGAGPKYLALYEAADSHVFQSPGYVALVSDPDPSSRHYILRFRNAIRTIARVTASVGEAEGAHLAVVPLTPAEGERDGLRRALIESAMPALAAMPGVIAAHLLERDDGLAATSTGRHARQGDRRLDWGLFVEATGAGPLKTAVARLQDEGPLRGISPAPLDGPAFLSLLYRVSPW